MEEASLPWPWEEECWMIAPTSSLQDWHAFVLDEEPWFVSLLVYNRNEDSFKHYDAP
jgi:hypothetical protein